MSREQMTELQQVLDIIRSAKSVKRKTIKGEQYHIAIWMDETGQDMQLILIGGGWSTVPADWPMK